MTQTVSGVSVAETPAGARIAGAATVEPARPDRAPGAAGGEPAAVDTAARPALQSAQPALARERARPGIGTVARRVVVLVLLLVQLLLVLRFGLLALVANQANPVVNATLQGAGLLETPFRGIFHTGAIAAGSGSVVDVTALVALMGWTLLQGALLAVLSLGSRSTRW